MLLLRREKQEMIFRKHMKHNKPQIKQALNKNKKLL